MDKLFNSKKELDELATNLINQLTSEDAESRKLAIKIIKTYNKHYRLFLSYYLPRCEYYRNHFRGSALTKYNDIHLTHENINFKGNRLYFLEHYKKNKIYYNKEDRSLIEECIIKELENDIINSYPRSIAYFDLKISLKF